MPRPRAIYGSRGANGVILITTKRGKSGKTSVTASASFTIADAAKLLDMINMTEYAQGRMIKGGPDTRSGGSADGLDA